MDDVPWKGLSVRYGDRRRWNGLTVLFLPDREGVVPFRLGKLAKIS